MRIEGFHIVPYAKIFNAKHFIPTHKITDFLFVYIFYSLSLFHFLCFDSTIIYILTRPVWNTKNRCRLFYPRNVFRDNFMCIRMLLRQFFFFLLFFSTLFADIQFSSFFIILAFVYLSNTSSYYLDSFQIVTIFCCCCAQFLKKKKTKIDEIWSKGDSRQNNRKDLTLPENINSMANENNCNVMLS